MRVLLALLITPIIVFCQNNKDVPKKLETITIYASMLDIHSLESGKNTTILGSNDIENLSFNSIDDLLKLIPSIDLQSRGGFGIPSDLVLRGSTFSQTLVLLDGMRVNDPLTGHFSMYIPINPFEIHQIEIIRGSGSSIYGPDAVGGVINIVTKSFVKSDKKNELVIQQKVGENNFHSSNLFVSKNINNKLYTTLSKHISESNGQNLYNENDPPTFFNNRTFSLSQRYIANDRLSIMLRNSYAERYFASKYFYTPYPTDQSNEFIEKIWTQNKIEYKIKPNSIVSINTAYQITNDTYIYNPTFPSTNENCTKLLNSTIHYNYTTNIHRLATGLNIQNRSMQSKDRGDHKDFYMGGFINYITSFNKFSINPSVRLDYNASYNLQFSPQIDINYNHTNYNIRASAGRTIRSADFTERFSHNNTSGILSPGRNIGNPDLNAETSINYEIGIDVKKYKNIEFKSTFFYRKASDLIDWSAMNSQTINTNIELVTDTIYFFAQNINKLNTLGLESEIWFRLLNNKSFNINGSMGYLKVFSSEKIEDIFKNENKLSSKYVATNAGDRFNYNLLFNIKSLNININGILKIRDSESIIDVNRSLNQSYFIHNLNVDFLISKNMVFKAEAMNIFNKDYADILGALMPKKWLMLGLTYSINN